MEACSPGEKLGPVEGTRGNAARSLAPAGGEIGAARTLTTKSGGAFSRRHPAGSPASPATGGKLLTFNLLTNQNVKPLTV